MKNVSTIWLVAVVLFLCACPTRGVVEFKDGLTHDIDYQIKNTVWVDYQAPLMYTTVNLLDGGRILCEHNPFVEHTLNGYGHSRINVCGGEIYAWLLSYDSSQVNVSGGKMGGLGSGDSSQVNVSGGSISEFSSSDSSRVNISGGSIGYALSSHDSSQIDITGGSIYKYLGSYDSSQVNISGGEICSNLSLFDNSTIQIFGSDFAVDGQPFGYGEITSILGGSPWDEPFRHLTGTLLSRELIDNDFRIGYDARIVLIPEPASAITLGLGGLFFVLRCRRQ